MAASAAGGTPFGGQLRRLRAAAGLTQEELAERAGLTAKGIAALERGRSRRPQAQTLRALAAALGLRDEERRRFFAILVPGATTAAAPPCAPDDADFGAIPRVPPTPLLGRAALVTGVSGALREGVRLVTLTGPGGVGKTRLAQEIAIRAAADFADGATVVSLAPLTDPALVIPALARTLGLRESSDRPQRDALHGWLRGRRSLVVLDNLEHLLAAADEIAALLAASPGLAILATSRAPLRLRGEREWAVPPLDLPRTGAADGADRDPWGHAAEARRAIADSPAVQLFVERARAVDPSFALSEANAGVIAAICHRLAGLPLALELAAARLRILPPAELLVRLDRALPLLGDGARDLPARQRTMRDTITWSYDLLPPAERALFRQLAPFSGGWTLAAAEELRPAGDATDPVDLLLHLSALVEQSLVVPVPGAPGAVPRFRMLEPIRHYAEEALAAHGEAAGARARHAAHFLALAERAGPELSRAEQARWLDRLAEEGDNLRAALDWFLARGQLDAAIRLGWAIHRAWWVRGQLAEWRRWRAAILPHRVQLAEPLRARALYTAACLAHAEGDHAGAGTLLAACLPLARAEGEPSLLVRALSLAGHAALGRGEIERGRAWFAETQAVADALGASWARGSLLNGLGYAAMMEGDFALAADLLGQGEAALRDTGATWNLGMNLCMRAAIAAWQGDYPRTSQLARASLALRAGRLDEAGASLAQLIPLRDTWVIAHPLVLLAGVAVAEGRAGRAARLLGAADVLREAIGLAIFFPADRALRERYIAQTRAHLGERDFAAAWAAGRAMPLGRALAEATARAAPGPAAGG